MLHGEYGKSFTRQVEKCRKHGKDIRKLERIVVRIAKGEVLEAKYRNHYFKDRMCWECHIEPDWLLIYRIYEKKLVLELLETGTHSDLF